MADQAPNQAGQTPNQTVDVIAKVLSVAIALGILAWMLFSGDGADNPGGGDANKPPAPEIPAGYTDATTIPSYPSREAMGKDHPRIFMDGQRLDYDAKSNRYYFAGTDVVAAWLEYGGGPGEPPVRQLAFTEKLEDGVWWRFNGREWVKVEKSELPQ